MNLKAKLDTLFSRYIRLRDANQYGYCRCISCGKIVHWQECDAGHYVNRKHMSLRYDEKNVNAQCRSCNRFDEGNAAGYHAGLVKKYGEGVIQYLEIKKHNTAHFSSAAYEALIKEYQQKIKQLQIP
jgi:hypothetical protein